MADPQVDIELPDGTKGTITADLETIRKARASGVKKFGTVPIFKGEESGTVSGDRLEKAIAQGWSIRGAEPAPSLTLEASLGIAPPAPTAAPAETTPWSVGLEDVDQASMQESQKALEREDFAREIAAQRKREELDASRERIHGAGLGSGAGALNLLQTTGEGLARGLSLGADFPMALAQAGVNKAVDAIAPANPDVPLTFGNAVGQARQDIADRAETNPVTATLSEIGGVALPALATSGASFALPAAPSLAQKVLARVPGALARTPAGWVERQAGRLGTSAAARLGLTGAVLENTGLSGTLARIGAPAVKLGTEGAVEGGAQGFMSTVNDMWRRDDYEGALGLLAQGIGENALLGTGLGTILGISGGALGTLGGAESGKKMVRRMGLTTERPPPGIVVGEAPLGTYPLPVENEGLRGAAAKTLRLTPEAASKLRDAKHGRIVKNMNEFLRLQDDIDNNLDLKDKRRFVLANAPEPADDLMITAIREEAGIPLSFFNQLANDTPIRVDAAGSAGVVARLRKQIDAVEDDLLNTAMERPLTKGDVFMAVDQMKRYMQKAANWANDRNPYLFEMLDPKTEGLRQFLMDTDVWPEAVADMQRRTNDAQTKAITAAKDAHLQGLTGAMGVASDFNNYDTKRKIMDSWLEGHTSRLGTPQEEQKALAFNRLLNAVVDDAAIRAGAYGSNAIQTTAERMATARRATQHDLGEVTSYNLKTVPGERRVKDALGALSQIPGSVYGTERAVDRARVWAHKKSADTLEKIDKAAELRALLQSPKTGMPAFVVRSAATLPKISAGVDRYLEQLNTNTPAEDESLAVIEASFGPEMAGAAGKANEARKAFLREKAAVRGPGTKQRLRRYAEAALRPVDAIERLASGTSSPEDLETLKTLYPTLYQRFAEKALETLSSAETTYDQRLRAARTLGLEAEAEPSLDPAHVEALQTLSTSGAGKPSETAEPTLAPSQRRPPKVSDMHTRGVPP